MGFSITGQLKRFDGSGGGTMIIIPPLSLENAAYDNTLYYVYGKPPSNPEINGFYIGDSGTKLFLCAASQILVYDLDQAYNLSRWKDSGTSVSVSGSTTSATDVVFNSTGTSFYVSSSSGDIYQYNMSSAWDVTTASFAASATVVTLGQGLFLSPDDTDMYLVRQNSSAILHYSMSTPGDLDTMTYTGDSYTFTEDGSVSDAVFDSTGTRLYVSGNQLNGIYQYSLSTPWDVTTISYVDSLNITSVQLTPRRVFYTNQTLYLQGGNPENLVKYDFDTDYDVTTLSDSGEKLSLGEIDSTFRGMFISSTGEKLYVAGRDGDRVYQYSLHNPFSLEYATYDFKSFDISAQTTGVNSVTISTDGTRMYITGAGTVFAYTLSTAWDVSTATLSASETFTEEPGPVDVKFSTDGGFMYLMSPSNDTVFQYSLSSEWDITTATYTSKSFSITQDTAPYGFDIDARGKTMLVTGNTTNTVYQYSLSTAWDISTASYDSVTLDVSTQDSLPLSVMISHMNDKVFILGVDSDAVYEYPTNLSA